MTPKEVATILNIRQLESYFGAETLFWFDSQADAKAFIQLCGAKYQKWMHTEQHPDLTWTAVWYHNGN